MRRSLLATLIGLGAALAAAGPASADSTIAAGLWGQGGGRVADAKGILDCTDYCSGDFERYFAVNDKAATLTASPDNGSVFTGWDGDCSGTQATCEIQPFYNSVRFVEAHFAPLPIFGIVGLNVALAGDGAGGVAGPGIACPGDCSQSYLKGAAVTITADSDPGSSFSGWSGACSGAAPTCTLTMSTGKKATATFAADPPSNGGTGTSGGTGGTGGGDGGQPGPQPAPGKCTIVGTAGNDLLTGTPGRDIICARGGNDTLVGAAGADVLIGGRGADLLRGGRGRDVLYARDGRRDRVNGGRGLDRARVDARDRKRSVEVTF
jgi:Ca2+-binding RTX toxin-like protein